MEFVKIVKVNMKDKKKRFLTLFLLVITSVFLFTIRKNIYCCYSYTENIIKFGNSKFDTQHYGIFQENVKKFDKNNLKDGKENSKKNKRENKKIETEESKKLDTLLKELKNSSQSCSKSIVSINCK